MKKLLLVLLVCSGCATNSTKATSYCDKNWTGRYESWQACYDRQYQEAQDRSQTRQKVFGHMGDGLIGSQGNCINRNNVITCSN